MTAYRRVYWLRSPRTDCRGRDQLRNLAYTGFEYGTTFTFSDIRDVKKATGSKATQVLSSQPQGQGRVPQGQGHSWTRPVISAYFTVLTIYLNFYLY